MGACDFQAIEAGASMAAAFSSARESAAYECGHGGYTGTIAEKGGFADFGPLPEGITLDMIEGAILAAEIAAGNVYGAGDENDEWNVKARADLAACEKAFRRFDLIAKTYNDKWGDACGFTLADGRFAFIGMASS